MKVEVAAVVVVVTSRCQSADMISQQEQTDTCHDDASGRVDRTLCMQERHFNVHLAVPKLWYSLCSGSSAT